MFLFTKFQNPAPPSLQLLSVIVLRFLYNSNQQNQMKCLLGQSAWKVIYKSNVPLSFVPKERLKVLKYSFKETILGKELLNEWTLFCFTLVVPLYDFMLRLKTLRHLVQHNKHYHRIGAANGFLEAFIWMVIPHTHSCNLHCTALQESILLVMI